MRQINDHKLSDLNQHIVVAAMDEPSNGGANHLYHIAVEALDGGKAHAAILQFQKGALKEVGLNGISDEALLAVIIDRLRGFQSGPLSCRDNAIALTHLETALMWLKHRTEERMNRNVEGTSAV